jgi:putative transposase
MIKSVSYKRHRFPPEIIAHAVWLYFRFPLSLRLVEKMLLERGILVSYETVRRRALKFGLEYVRRLKRKRPSQRDIWHLDEVVVTIAGQKHWLWRAVDQDGYVLDEIVQARRDTKAAKRMLRRLLKKQVYPPRRLVTDKLGSYAAARRQIMPAIEHRSHKGLNNRAENSHLSLRKRERARSVHGTRRNYAEYPLVCGERTSTQSRLRAVDQPQRILRLLFIDYVRSRPHQRCCTDFFVWCSNIQPL